MAEPRLHLYRIDEGGEHFAWPGVTEADAFRRHAEFVKRDTDEAVDPVDCTVRRYDDDEICRVRGDDSDIVIPTGGHYDPVTMQAVATAAQWAAHSSRATSPAFGSVY